MVLVVFNTEVVCYENGHFGTTDTYRYMYVLQVSNIFYIASLFLEQKKMQTKPQPKPTLLLWSTKHSDSCPRKFN